MALIACVNIPPGGNTGDVLYSLDTKEFYEYDALTSASLPTWNLLPPGRYDAATAPPIQPSTGFPAINVWVDTNDPERIPHLYDPSGNSWLPLLPKSYSYPPANPNIGDFWHETMTRTIYMYNGTKGVSSSSGWVVLNTVTPHAYAAASQPTLSPAAQRNQANIQWTGSGAIGGGALSGSLLTTASPLTNYASFTIGPSSTDLLEISDEKGKLVTLTKSGSIIYAQRYTPAAAAKIFWETLANISTPVAENRELIELREKVKYADAKGFKWPKKQDTLDPKAAWDAAMGIIS